MDVRLQRHAGRATTSRMRPARTVTGNKGQRYDPLGAAVLPLNTRMLACPKCGAVYTRDLDFCGLDGQRLRRTEADPLLGKVIDRYRIDSVLGAGGMARVYKAHHIYLETDFALKLLHGEIASDKDLSRRFHREAKTLSRIKHDNVVQVADFGSTKDGLLFMVMELAEGPTLSQLLRDQGPLSPPRAAQITKDVAQGLSAAHKKGFVHRDLKPGNVALVGPPGREQAKILDFGLVRILSKDEEATRLTQQGMFFGTPAYMSPEQITGDDVGPGADLYSLGIILYQMVTGHLPFTGDVKQLAHAHVGTKPSRPPLEYGGLTDLAMDLLAKSPADRPQSGEEVARRVEQFTFSSPPTPVAMRRVEIEQPNLHPTAEHAFQEEFDDPGAMDQSIRAALGVRAYVGSWVPLTAFVLVAAAVAFYFYNGRKFDLPSSWSFGGAADTEVMNAVDLPPEPAPTLRPADSDVAEEILPTPKKRRRRRRRRAKDVRKSGVRTPPKIEEPDIPIAPPAVESPPPVIEAPPPAIEPPPPAIEPPPPANDVAVEAVGEGGPKSFKELDLALGWLLAQRGLSFDDLLERERDAARKWGRWYRRANRGSAADVQATFNTLETAAKNIEIDAALVNQKLGRINKMMRRAEGEASGPRWDSLRARHKSVRQTAKVRPADAVAELTLMEGNLKVLIRELDAKSKAAAKDGSSGGRSRGTNETAATSTTN